MAVTPDQIMADVVATLAPLVTAGTLKSANDGAPERAPVQGPEAWCEYAGCAIQQGGLEIRLHTITVSVATPRKGDYPGECKAIRNAALTVLEAFRGNTLVAGEAAMTSDATMSKPGGAAYAGEQDAIVACVVTFVLETLDDVVSQITV